jgi:hypothetical protein
MDKRKKHVCTNCHKLVRAKYWPEGPWGNEKPFCSWNCVMEYKFPHELENRRRKENE